jgi:predicted transcriptional regulator
MGRANGKRHSILDIAPLELECLHALWPLGEATVRDICAHVSERRPRAYTTVMTIMDRLAQKGVVTRRRVGRAWIYHPALSAEEARRRAVGQLVEHFFSGSSEALVDHLGGKTSEEAARRKAPVKPSELEVSLPERLDESLL